MAELATLARPYARAVFDRANETSSLESWSTALNLLAAVAGQDKIKMLCESPAVSAEQRASAMIDVCGDALDQQAKNLLYLLAENGRLPLLPELVRQFEQMKAALERTVDVEVSSAFPLDDAAEKHLAQALQKKLDRSVRLTSSVDKSLLGGVIVRAGDLVIDGSMRGKLGKLADSLGV